MAGASFGLFPVRLEDQMNTGKHEGDQNGSHNGATPHIDEFPSKIHMKPRPRSSQGIRSVLSPSPSIIESRRSSKDDSDVLPTPSTPKRYSSLSHGLSLQMPPRDLSSTSTANLSKRIPISPRPDCTAAYPSPTSVLPRRSRGLDFARAATNLHHSVLAESSPESSPTVSGRRGLNLPGRRSVFAAADYRNDPDTMKNTSSSHWTALTNGGGGGVLSSSVGSSAIMDNDSSSTSSDEMMDIGDDDEDTTIHMTPHNGPHLLNPFAPIATSPGGDSMGAMTPAAAKLMSYQRNRRQSRRNRTRGSSSSASGQSNMQSPMPPSPPLLRSIESNLSMSGGYFLDDSTRKEIDSRRESLSLGTNEMQISDAEQSTDETHTPIVPQEDLPIPTPVTPSMEERRQVIRKAVTRRSNLLPKSKGFARIKAALLEEGAPIDTELRREAEVVRQVRDGDGDGDLSLQPSQPTTSASSPSLGPITAGPTETIDGNSGDLSTSSEDSMRRRSSNAFISQAARNSGCTTFWNKFDERMRTPPPPPLQRANSSGMSDDMNVDVTQSSAATLTPQANGIFKSNSNDSTVTNASNMTTTTFEVPRKGTKRMREDDFDPNYFKRRAVSPGLSVQNSPVLPQSPGWWGTPKREERVSSNGSAGSGAGTGKRVGMQGMIDTHDGLMNMSIE